MVRPLPVSLLKPKPEAVSKAFLEIIFIQVLDFWLGPLQAYSLQTASGAESLYKYAKEDTLVRLEELRTDFSNQSKQIRDILGKLQRGVGKEQEGLQKAMREHERLWMHRLEKTAQRALSSLPSSDSINSAELEQKDVWLSQLQLHNQIDAYLEAKRKFCSTLMELYSDTRMLNAECSRRLSQTITEHFTVRSKHLLAQVEHLKDVARGIEAVEPEGEWANALVRAKLDYDWVLEAPPSDGFTHSILHQISASITSIAGSGERSAAASPLSRAPSHSLVVKPIGISKTGLIMKTGSTFGPSWIVGFAVLTEGNFLHIYADVKSRRKSDISSYTIPSPDDQLSKRHLADMNVSITKFWFNQMDSRLLEPYLSIALTEGITVSVEEPTENIWRILIPGAQGFFGRSDKKYQFRSFLEEDMVDWCIAIKESIAANQASVNQMAQLTHQESGQPTLAQPTWTSTQENIIGEDPYLNEEDIEIDTGLSALSLSTTSEVKPPTGPTFNLENPWG